MRFLVATAVALLDPLSQLGWILSGILARRLWLALPLSAIWSIAMEIFVIVISIDGMTAGTRFPG
jgi:hypothetical protein